MVSSGSVTCLLSVCVLPFLPWEVSHEDLASVLCRSAGLGTEKR